MKILNKFIWSKTEPKNKNDIWFDGSVFNLYRNDTWEAFTLPVDAAEKVAEVIKNVSEVYQEKLNAGYGIIIEGNTISVDPNLKNYDDTGIKKDISDLKANDALQDAELAKLSEEVGKKVDAAFVNNAIAEAIGEAIDGGY